MPRSYMGLEKDERPQGWYQRRREAVPKEDRRPKRKSKRKPRINFALLDQELVIDATEKATGYTMALLTAPPSGHQGIARARTLLALNLSTYSGLTHQQIASILPNYYTQLASDMKEMKRRCMAYCKAFDPELKEWVDECNYSLKYLQKVFSASPASTE